MTPIDKKYEREYVCVYNPATGLLLGLGLRGSKLIFAWMDDDPDNPLVFSNHKTVASFSGPEGSTIKDVSDKVKEAFDAPNFPDIETLNGCVLIPVLLNEALDVVDIYYDMKYGGYFDNV